METVQETILQLLQQIPRGIRIVWIWGILPCLPLFYTLIGGFFLTVHHSSWEKQLSLMQNDGWESWYYHNFQYFRRSAVYVTMVLFILPLFFYVNLQHEGLILSLTESTDTICTMAIGLTTIVLTAAVVIVLFHKSYYLVFSISDVLKSYHFSECIGVVLASCLFICIGDLISLYLEPDENLSMLILIVMEWCILCNLFATAVSFWTIYQVMFSDEKVELRLLDRLYEAFSGGSLFYRMKQEKNAQTWKWDDVRTNVEYLCTEYMAAALRLPIYRVKRFHYLTGKEREAAFKTWYQRRLTLCCIGVVVTWLVSMIVVTHFLGKEGWGLILLGIAATVLCLILLLSMKNKIRDTLHPVLGSYMGYVVDMQKRKRIRIYRYSVRYAGKYRKFVRRMNSLTAFFYLAIEKGVSWDVLEQALGVVKDCCQDVPDKNDCFCLPFFASGYFAFTNGEKIPSVKEFYQSMEFTGENKNKEGESENQMENEAFEQIEKMIVPEDIKESQTQFDEMLCGYLTDLLEGLAGKCRENDPTVNSYLVWLHGEQESMG